MYMVAEIVGTLRDTHSSPWFARVVKALPDDSVRNILGGSDAGGMAIDVAGNGGRALTRSVRSARM